VFIAPSHFLRGGLHRLGGLGRGNRLRLGVVFLRRQANRIPGKRRNGRGRNFRQRGCLNGLAADRRRTLSGLSRWGARDRRLDHSRIGADTCSAIGGVREGGLRRGGGGRHAGGVQVRSRHGRFGRFGGFRRRFGRCRRGLLGGLDLRRFGRGGCSIGELPLDLAEVAVELAQFLDVSGDQSRQLVVQLFGRTGDAQRRIAHRVLVPLAIPFRIDGYGQCVADLGRGENHRSAFEQRQQ